jgi:hypothetical protein
MNRDYKVPMNLFLILEKASPFIFTSRALCNNHYIILLEKKFLKTSMNIFKNDLVF